MTAPNIVGVNTITGITTSLHLTTTPQTIISNAFDSNRVYKVNNILISNKDGSSAANVFVKFHPYGATGAGSSVSIAHEISVAADSSLVVLDKASAIYLEENKSIVAYSSANDDLDIISSFEIIEWYFLVKQTILGDNKSGNYNWILFF